MPWASTDPISGFPASKAGTCPATRALAPLASTVIAVSSPSPVTMTRITPPRGIAAAAMRQRLSASFTLFFGMRTRAACHSSLVRSSTRSPRATCSASPVSIAAPAEPAAPKASRQNCSRAEAVRALFLMSSRANERISASCSSSSTSRPLTMAPTGEITSWQTREQRRAARSRESKANSVMRVSSDFEDQVLRARSECDATTQARYCSERIEPMRQLALLTPPIVLAKQHAASGAAHLREKLIDLALGVIRPRGEPTRPLDDLGGGRNILPGNALDLADALLGAGGMIGNHAHGLRDGARRRRLLLHGGGDGGGEGGHVLHPLDDAAYLSGRAFRRLLYGGDLQRDVLGGARGLIGERLHLRRHHPEAASGLAGACRLDRRVQRQKVRLPRNLGNHLDDRADLLRRLAEIAQGRHRRLGVARGGLRQRQAVGALAIDLGDRFFQLIGRADRQRDAARHLGGGGGRDLGAARRLLSARAHRFGPRKQRSGSAFEIAQERADLLLETADRRVDIVVAQRVRFGEGVLV